MAHNKKHRREERKAKREERKAMLEEERTKKRKQFDLEDQDTKDTAGQTTIPEARLGGERLTLLNLIKRSKK
jgi:hypothetical protein